MGDCVSWCNPVFKRVEALPDLDYATRNHAYIMPDDKAYILNEAGDGFTELTSTATTVGTTYDDKPLVARVEKLEAKEDNDKQTLSINNRTISISNGNSITVPTSIGKSAYQSWLDIGNTGTEQDFIKSLKGSKGDKGDVTDIGANALVNFTCDITSTLVPTTEPHYDTYRKLSYNTKTNIGILHLDITPSSNIPDAHIIGKLPDDAPKPYTLIEVDVYGSKPSGSGQVYISTNGIIRCNGLIPGRRYIVNLIGYYI